MRPRSCRWLLAALLCAALQTAAIPLVHASRAGAESAADSSWTLQGLIDHAYAQDWDTLAIGERVARFGLALEGMPYVDGTLEGPGPEICRVTMRGFDCVTFMELCLDLARAVGDRHARATPQSVRDAVQFTRYRGGRLTDYTSRLHYTSEWIADNVRKGVIEDVTPALDGVDCGTHVGFMSTHPDRYPALVAHPAFVDSMRVIERAINRMSRTCIPKDSVAAVESRFHTGDLVAIATSIAGLDYSHTGMIVRGADGVPQFLHASSKHGRVTLDGRLSHYLAEGPKHNTGVTIVRPLEVRGRR